ncbi:MAG: hypothetical protein N3A69_11640 [Leptospiraceae bacterium]|nr:hypothetical protein [Leptospiraceae bacterium]
MAQFKPKPMLNRSELRQIKKSRTRVQGKKVLTDDVKKLKSLKVTPDISPEEAIHYYKEPIWIEYYIPKESRFALEIKYLFIKLIDIEPRDGRDEYLREAIEKNEIVNVHQILKGKKTPEKELIMRSYQNSLSMFETIDDQLEQFHFTGDYNLLLPALYITETLMLFEPTLASLEVLGNFCLYNMQWFIRKLNEGNVTFSLEDRNVLLLIKRRNEYWEEHNLPEDEDFELFAALFFEQAYPHRGAEQLEEQDFLVH